MMFFINLYMMNLQKYRYVMMVPVVQNNLGVCIRALDKCARKKSKYVMANNIPLIDQEISKALMNRTRLRSNHQRRSLKKVFLKIS